MEFNEKFSALLALTSVKGNSLAKAINIDSAQISRFRTGARKMPGNPAILRDISNYLSSYFDSGYRMTGLFELTGDQRLHTDVTQLQIADIIYTYLTNKDPVSSNKEMHRFLNRINNFLPTELTGGCQYRLRNCTLSFCKYGFNFISKKSRKETSSASFLLIFIVTRYALCNLHLFGRIGRVALRG